MEKQLTLRKAVEPGNDATPIHLFLVREGNKKPKKIQRCIIYYIVIVIPAPQKQGGPMGTLRIPLTN